MTRTLDLTVVGEPSIHCAGCESRIGNVLRRLPGVEDAQASSRSQRVAVTFDPAQVSPEQIRSKLEFLGYQVAPNGDAE